MENKDFKILLVDDEPDILEFLSFNIIKEGFEVHTAQNGKEALKIAKDIKPHLIILDVMMPEMDGIETCEILRQDKEMQNTIIAFLTARGEDYSQIAGFEAGGDDYISKPVKPRVLVSRIKALLKRYKSYVDDSYENNSIIKQSNIEIDKEKYIVKKDEEEMVLPKKEFELLILLISKPDRVFTRDEIFRSVWGDDIIVGDRTIDVHIRKLREKIGENHIKTIKGVGYKFID
ncbi:MAG: response regulator transcription factor [Bacteroidales bacterium]|jgi:two-component system alkaline phosphatase synthesis response regulator PhoP|nr:response regulator transcription factor [Bacteroidales bacterium]